MDLCSDVYMYEIVIILIILYSYLHVKIEGGETTLMLCPAYGCYKFISMVGLYFNSYVITMATIGHNTQYYI